MRVPHHQDTLAPFVSGTSEVNGPFGLEECGARLCDKSAPGIGYIHNSTLFANQKPQLILFFEFCDLFAERWLADAQYVGGSCEVQLLSQNDDRLQITSFNVGKHWSKPRSRAW
jgi:hypothetical protein